MVETLYRGTTRQGLLIWFPTRLEHSLAVFANGEHVICLIEPLLDRQKVPSPRRIRRRDAQRTAAPSNSMILLDRVSVVTVITPVGRNIKSNLRAIGSMRRKADRGKGNWRERSLF